MYICRKTVLQIRNATGRINAQQLQIIVIHCSTLHMLELLKSKEMYVGK